MIIFYGNGNDSHYIGTGLFIHKGIISAVKRTEFLSDMKLCIILRGQWCDTVVLNMHATTEVESDDMKDSFHKELQLVFNQVMKYDMKISLGDFNTKVGIQDIFKPTTWNESLHEISNNSRVRVDFVASKTLSWTEGTQPD
jgi:hypothetical protein